MPRNTSDFHDKLKKLMNEYAHRIYDVTADFPREEIYGITSQLRKSAMSVVLNYIEGYARRKKGYLEQFLEMSYGSFKESKYLTHFSMKRGFIDNDTYQELNSLEEEIGRMLWGTISKL